MKTQEKTRARGRVRTRVREKVSGSPERPRLAVFKSGRHIYAQIIDDRSGHTLACASSLDSGVEVEGRDKDKDKDKEKGQGKSRAKATANVATAKQVGRLVADRAKARGIAKVVFDRGGYIYHGKVRALADAAREGGLEF